jgi:hypothetical protein
LEGNTLATIEGQQYQQTVTEDEFIELLERELDQWIAEGYTPEEINNGQCRVFAEEISMAVENVFVRNGNCHSWLEFQGKCYDSECIHGVDNWKHLPFYQRHPEYIT